MGLDSVELVMEVEKRFGIRLPDSEVEQVRTVADLSALVIAALQDAALSNEERTRAEQRITEEIRRIAAGVVGLPVEKVFPHSDLVRDLGMD